MPTSLSTANAAKFFIALTLLSNPTISKIPELLEQPTRQIQKTTSLSPMMQVSSSLTSIVDNDNKFEDTARPTTLQEKLIGEIRQWCLLDTDWDGEGSYQPSDQSLKDSVSFISLLSQNMSIPEPMLLASGNAALYLNENNLYADIEFLGDGRIAYYVERNSDKHKGVLEFNPEEMPALFQVLLAA
ncbi:hypothetical protein [Methyloglobulus sp.]|uniref:hypothetical protein n=1 Tax=Methyloglobulus sp. TaxID=2518622 RepID=UPI003988DD35